MRFRLPDPVAATVDKEHAHGVWITEPDPNRAVMMQVPKLGAFVRCLLPVRLTDGFTVTFGLWLAVHPDDLQRAARAWFDPAYAELAFEGRLANAIPPWGLLAAQAQARVVDPDATPYVVASDDPALSQVLTTEWPHDDVLSVLPS